MEVGKWNGGVFGSEGGNGDGDEWEFGCFCCEVCLVWALGRGGGEGVDGVIFARNLDLFTTLPSLPRPDYLQGILKTTL